MTVQVQQLGERVRSMQALSPPPRLSDQQVVQLRRLIRNDTRR